MLGKVPSGKGREIVVEKRPLETKVHPGVDPRKGQKRVQRSSRLGRRHTFNLAFLQLLGRCPGLVGLGYQRDPNQRSSRQPEGIFQLESQRPFGKGSRQYIVAVELNRCQGQLENIKEIELRADPELKGDCRADQEHKRQSQRIYPRQGSDRVGQQTVSLSRSSKGKRIILALVVAIGCVVVVAVKVEEGERKDGETESKGRQTQAGKIDTHSRVALGLVLLGGLSGLVDGGRVPVAVTDGGVAMLVCGDIKVVLVQVVFESVILIQVNGLS